MESRREVDLMASAASVHLCCLDQPGSEVNRADLELFFVQWNMQTVSRTSAGRKVRMPEVENAPNLHVEKPR